MKAEPYTEIYVEPSFPDKLITILARPDLPDNVSARWIARQMQRPWRDVGKHVRASPKVLKVMAELGWTYRSEIGCKARCAFQRGEAALQRNANCAEEPRRDLVPTSRFDLQAA
jgi:hypothetical protein